MAATAIQPTTTVSFRASGSKPSPVQVFVKAGQKWIVASEVCRILGIRTDSVPQLIPEKDRSRAAVLTKGSVQSVTTITEAGFNLLVAQSAKPAAKALREWMVGTADLRAALALLPTGEIPPHPAPVEIREAVVDYLRRSRPRSTTTARFQGTRTSSRSGMCRALTERTVSRLPDSPPSPSSKAPMSVVC